MGPKRDQIGRQSRRGSSLVRIMGSGGLAVAIGFGFWPADSRGESSAPTATTTRSTPNLKSSPSTASPSPTTARMHDSMDGGGRAASGTAAEEVGQRRDQLPKGSGPAACFAPARSASAGNPKAYHLMPPKPRPRDRSCYITVGSVLPPGKNNYTFVDVRPSDAFARYRIPGALNIPLNAVKSKAFLKTTPIVLVNEGRSTAALETACVELKKAGFTRVAILQGGLNAWHIRGGALAGDPFVQADLNRMSPEELFVESRYNDWLVLDVSGASKADVKKRLPQAVSLGKATNNAAFISSVKSAVNNKKRAVPNPNILFINEAGADYEKLDRLVRAAGITNVFYLQGGLAGYRDLEARQIAMWNQLDNPPKAMACSG